jgi:hypothetical protein
LDAKHAVLNELAIQPVRDAGTTHHARTAAAEVIAGGSMPSAAF